MGKMCKYMRVGRLAWGDDRTGGSTNLRIVACIAMHKKGIPLTTHPENGMYRSDSPDVRVGPALFSEKIRQPDE